MSKRDPFEISRPWSSLKFWQERFEKRDTPWDLGELVPTLTELEKTLSQGRNPARASTKVIVPGCGTGSDVIGFARLGYSVTGIDWSQSAIQLLLLKAANDCPGSEIRVHRGNFWDLPVSWNRTFDLWVEHTFFCAIDPADRGRYVIQAANLLKPGADFIGVFFVESENLAKNAIDKVVDGPPFLTTEDEIKALFHLDFEILRLEPTPWPHPKRYRGLEWAAHFRRR